MKRLLVIFLVMGLVGGSAFSQKKEAYRVRTVVIDPGHGGAKPGAQGSRSWEKNITLSVAKKFGKLIQDNYPDVKVIFTRTTDVDISLAERARIANRNKADLFISIHANSHPSSTPTGVETFVMGLSESRANLEVAKKENADILLEADYKTNKDYAGFDPNSEESYIIFTLTQNAYLEKSLNFAQAIQSQYKNNLRTINRGVKQAELFVLYKTAMPSVLTEIGFISNPGEESFMLSDEGQAKIALSLFNAFMNFKAAEEGSNRIANPVINIKGYTPPATAKKPAAEAQHVAQAQPKDEPKAEVKPEPKAEPKPEPKAEPTPEPAPEPKAAPATEPKPEPKAAPKPEETPAVAPKTPQEKPLPPTALPQQTVVKTEPAAAPQPAPQQAHKEEPKEEPKAEAAPAPQAAPAAAPAPAEKETLQDPQNTAADDATTYYTVQFLTAPNEYAAGAAELNGVRDFKITKQGKHYAYNTGRFNTLDEARAYCKHLKSTTPFKDAWAHIFQEPGAKPAAAQAEAQKPAKAAEQQPKATEPQYKAMAPMKGLTYRVQFCTTKKQMKAGDPDLQGIKDVRSAQSGQYFIHTTGNYASPDEAEKRCNTIKRTTGFKDAFVIAIYNGERISLEQAKALRQQNPKGK